MKRICSECGKEFIPAKHNSLTCSPKCSKDHARRMTRERRSAARAQKRIAGKPCSCCGKLFVAEKRQTFCSDECREIMRGNKSAGREKKKRKADLLGAKLSNLHDAGISYAEYQKRDTLSRIEPIKRSL